MLVAAIQASLIDAGEGAEQSSTTAAGPSAQPAQLTNGRKETAEGVSAKAAPGNPGSAPKDFIPTVSTENSEFVQQARPHPAS